MVTESVYGTLADGSVMHAYTMENGTGVRAVVSDLGADLVELWVTDKDGKERDVVLGHPTAADYLQNNCCFGAVVGRVANRIGRASFELNGKTYELAKNDNGKNNLHSNPGSYYTRFWDVETGESGLGPYVMFSLVSPDGDQGYPGTLQVSVTYTLTKERSLMIVYRMVSDEDTIVNMTNHSYFNLNGTGSGDILGHVLTINADAVTPSDAELIPTGEIASVKGTPFDFTSPKTIGQDIHADNEQLKNGSGYDHNFVLNASLDGEGDCRLAATLHAPESGITMEVYTDLPGMQLYTANTTDCAGKNGARNGNFSGVCFETQCFPDAVHHDNFPSIVLKAGEEQETSTVFRFPADL